METEMDEMFIIHENARIKKKEREHNWDQKINEYDIEKPLEPYDEYRKDVFKYMRRDSDLPYVLADFKSNFAKYPIVYQMRIIISIWVELDVTSPAIRRTINATIRKIHKSEPKALKKARTEIMRNELETLNLIQYDEKGNEYIEVFRGVDCFSASSDTAISWTYNRNKAEWFANRFACLHINDGSCRVLQGKIYVKDILSIEYGRGEDEIIAFPHKVFDVSDVEDFVANYNHER
jgi:hypothetical protein